MSVFTVQMTKVCKIACKHDSCVLIARMVLANAKEMTNAKRWLFVWFVFIVVIVVVCSLFLSHFATGWMSIIVRVTHFCFVYYVQILFICQPSINWRFICDPQSIFVSLNACFCLSAVCVAILSIFIWFNRAILSQFQIYGVLATNKNEYICDAIWCHARFKITSTLCDVFIKYLIHTFFCFFPITDYVLAV